MEQKPRKPFSEEVVREFPPIGRYRVRLLRNPKRPAEEPTLDIREFISEEKFEGFTRRGIRLGERGQMDLLRSILQELLTQPAAAVS